jgi:hypothetical protein
VCDDPKRRPAPDLVSGFALLFYYATTAFSATAVIRDSIKKSFGADARASRILRGRLRGPMVGPV